MDPQHLDDRALFDRVAAGASDAATWAAFVSRFSKLCFHAIHRVIVRYPWTNPGDADELFQRLFEHLLADDRKALKRFRGENGCTPRTYLAHMASYRALEFVREHDRQQRGRTLSTEAALDPVARLPDREPSPEMEVQQRQDLARIHRALDTLSDSDRTLYELHYVRGMNFTEISSLLSKSETAVHIQHFRMKERLRMVLVDDR